MAISRSLGDPLMRGLIGSLLMSGLVTLLLTPSSTAYARADWVIHGLGAASAIGSRK